MNAALQSYIELLETLCKLCEAKEDNEFYDNLKTLLCIVRKVNEYKYFPLNLDSSFVSSFSTFKEDWQPERVELCHQLYVSLATLRCEFVPPAQAYSSYFSYMLEYARTSFPFEIANDWYKESLENNHFSVVFFALLDQNSRVLHNSKEEYVEYVKKIRELSKPNCPIEKKIPDRILNDLKNCYTKYYNEYCESIEKLYPEIKELFLNYNSNLRIYVCSYNVLQDNPKIDFVIALFYRSDKRDVFIYPNYVNFAYRFSNIEEIKDHIEDAEMCAFKIEGEIFNFMPISRIHHAANDLFVKHSNIELLREYICYFLRGQLYPVKVMADNLLQCKQKNYLLCKEDMTFDDVKDLVQKDPNSFFVFLNNPSSSIEVFLKDQNVPYSFFSNYGREMINNNNANMVYWFIRNNLCDLKKVRIDKGANLLIKKLESCPSGKSNWHEFELIGTDIFDYLFKDSFIEYQSCLQSATKDKIQRRDLVVNNNFKNQDSFWARMNKQFGCNMIIVDFKNYSDEIDSDCIYNVTKYMTTNTGFFVLIFSRKGIDESGVGEQLRLLREGKLVLCLSDKELTEMLQLKQMNENPDNVLNRLLFTLMQGQ